MEKDTFKIPLQCPSCGKSGEAICWQEDGWAFSRGDSATAVTDISEGCSRVNKPSFWGEGLNFVCNECGELSVDKQTEL